MIRRMWAYMHVSRRPSCAQDHLTRALLCGASPEARRAQTGPLWLPLGASRAPMLCCQASPDGDGGLPVLLALASLPHSARVSCGDRAVPPRPGTARAPTAACWLEARPPAGAHGPAHPAPPGLWRVSHPVEWCHTGSDAARPAGHAGVCGDGAPLAPGPRLGVETCAADRPRPHPLPDGALGAPALGGGVSAALGRAGLGRCAGHPAAAHSGGEVEAQGHAGDRGTLALPRPPEHQRPLPGAARRPGGALSCSAG